MQSTASLSARNFEDMEYAFRVNISDCSSAQWNMSMWNAQRIIQPNNVLVLPLIC